MIGVSVDMGDFNSEIVDMQRSLAEFIPKELQRISLTTFAKIRNRIQETGKDSKGAQYPKYSDNELPTFFFENKATNSGGRAAIKKAEEENRGLSYEEFKSANNGPKSVAYRNLTLSGNMWRDHGITSTEQESTGLVVTISGETQSAKDKARWNATQIGDFMRVSDKENVEVTGDFQHSIDEFAKTL